MDLSQLHDNIVGSARNWSISNSNTKLLKLINISTNKDSPIIQNSGCYKIMFVGYQTGFNVGVNKNSWKVGSFDSFVAKGNMKNIFWVTSL